MAKKNLLENLQKLKGVIAKGKKLDLNIDQHREKRSIDANAYMWTILSEMTTVLKTTKEELYILMLERYGVFTHVVVKPNVVDRVKHEWRTVKELGEVTINGQTGIQLQCFFGSSTYDSKEMSNLIEGVISEAQEIGIDTMTDSQRQLMLQQWGNKKAS